MVIYKIKQLLWQKQIDTGQPLTYEDVAKATGMGRATIARLASPKTDYNPTMKVVEKLAKYFGVQIGDLATIVDEESEAA
tara:strand:- start:9600 stop:9839 length:240 start_codon:yes stop_codon:yes gene_type:complete